MNTIDDNALLLSRQWKQPLEDTNELVHNALFDHYMGDANANELAETLKYVAGTLDSLLASTDAIDLLLGNKPETPALLEESHLSFGATMLLWDDSAAISTHPRTLFEAVRNLVSNAKRTKPEGAVTIEASSKAKGSVEIVITDNCGGIPDEAMKRFTDNERSLACQQGWELGLVISRRLIEEVLQGKLSIESPYTHPNGSIGSRFTVTIPELGEER